MFQNMKISTKLSVGFWLTVIFMIIVIIFAVFQTHTLFKLTSYLGDSSPMTKSDVAHHVSINIIKMLNSIKEIAIIKEEVDLEVAKQTIDSYERKIKNSFKTMEKFFVDKRKLDKVKDLFENEWKSIRNHVIALRERGDRNGAVNYILKGKGAQHIIKLEEATLSLHDFMDKQAQTFLTQTHLIAIKSLWLSMGMVIVLLIGGWLVFAISYHNVLKQFGLAVEIAEAMAIVNVKEYLQYDTETESGQLLQRLETMQTQLREGLQEIDKMEAQVRQFEEEKRFETARINNALDKAFTGFFLEESDDYIE